VTGRGKSCYCWNLNNTKAGEQYEGEYTCLPILNEVLDGRTVWFCPEGELTAGPGSPIRGKVWPVPEGHPQSRFRAFRSLAGAAEEKIRWFLESGGGRWRKAFDLAWEGKPAEYVDEIKRQNFFTAPVDPYRRAVVSLFHTRLSVARATREGTVTPGLPPDFDELGSETCRDMAACFRFPLPADLRARLEATRSEHVHDVMDRLRADRDRELREWADETEPTSPETPESKGDG
jgi:hypothetical protein